MNKYIDDTLQLAEIFIEKENVKKKIEKMELNRKLRSERKHKHK